MSKFTFPVGYPQRVYRADIGEYVTAGGCTASEAHTFAHRAADFIEQNPRRYDFKRAFTPHGDDPASIGCMLGWMGHFAGAPADMPVTRIATAILGVSEMGFYLFHPPATHFKTIASFAEWIKSPMSYETPAGAVEHLRAYADHQLQKKMKFAAAA